MLDLWPEHLRSRRGQAPVAILREQAALLEKKTQNVIVGIIEPSYLPRVAVREKYGTDEDLFMYDFVLKVSLLDNYHYNLFTIFHGIDLYPVIINTDEAIKRELSGNIYNFTADNEEQFLDLLKRIFNAGRTVTIINSLLSQLKGIVPTSSP